MACARSRTDEGDCASGQSWFSFSLPDFPLKSTLVFCWRGRVFLFSSPPHKPQVKESILALAASGREKEKAGHRTRIASRLSLVAEAVGFEPTSPCGLPDFESGPL